MDQIKIMKHFTGKYRLLLGEMRIAVSVKQAKEIIAKYQLAKIEVDGMGSEIFST